MTEFERGDIVVMALQGEHGKPRPALVVQATQFAATGRYAVVPITSALLDAPLLRVDILASPETGLRQSSQATLTRLTTADRTRIDRAIGRVNDETMLEISRKLAVFLGIAA